MSASPSTRKSEILATDDVAHLDESIQSAPCISLETDSTGVTDNSKLLEYVRCLTKKRRSSVEICWEQHHFKYIQEDRTGHT